MLIFYKTFCIISSQIVNYVIVFELIWNILLVTTASYNCKNYSSSAFNETLKNL
jgi:hypothetical protein